MFILVSRLAAASAAGRAAVHVCAPAPEAVANVRAAIRAAPRYDRPRTIMWASSTKKVDQSSSRSRAAHQYGDFRPDAKEAEGSHPYRARRAT